MDNNLKIRLLQHLDPQSYFRIYEFTCADAQEKKPMVIFEISAALHQPEKFIQEDYIRYVSDYQ